MRGLAQRAQIIRMGPIPVPRNHPHNVAEQGQVSRGLLASSNSNAPLPQSCLSSSLSGIAFLSVNA